MIAKINELKRTTTIDSVKSLCETTIAAMSSAIYNAVTAEARFEIERVATQNLFEGLSKYPKDKLISKWLDTQERLYSIKNIGVRESINALRADAKDDQALYILLERFQEKIDQYPEVLIYEEFISALSGEYNWVPSVTTQLDKLKNRIDNYKKDIDITKIIETMKLTRSNYLLPYIEDFVNNYLTNKTEQTKSFLKEALVKFSYDPFVRDIINAVMLDASDLQLEYVNAQSAIEKVHTPLMYLGENEVLFNMKGTFYVKKGNNINKLKSEEIEKIDENFRSLCEAINLPNVQFDKKTIKVYDGNDLAVIDENGVTLNNHVMNEQQFKDATEVSQWTGKTNFYMLVETLRANFDEIVSVDFAKRVYLKENESHCADIIKLRNNIYITTFDPRNNKSTFYRNINPIQAERVMNEHMNFDVSAAFADILPNKEKILNSINESKREYIDFMNTLREKIELFKTQVPNAVAQEVIEALEEELRDVKSEYKDYVNEIESYTDVSESITVTIDADGERYTVPIPQKSSTAKGEENDNDPGTIVGAENMEPSPATEVTFNDDETELLGDSPSIQDDKVDLGVDNVEAAADAAEAGEEDEEGESETGDGEEEIDLAPEDGEEVAPEDEEAEDDGLGLEDEEDEKPTKKEEDDENAPEFSKKTALLDDTVDTEAPEELEAGDLEVEEPEELEAGEPETIKEPDENHPAEIGPRGEDGESGEEGKAEVEDVEVKEKPKNAPKVFLKKTKVQESLKGKKKVKVNESIQIGDTVKLNNEKGFVIGETQGDLIIQVQGNTYRVNPNEVKAYREKPETIVKPPYNFDKNGQNLTTKAMFEQYVKCGIFERNAAIKTNNCFVKFEDFNSAEENQKIPIIIESKTSLLPKSNIRLLEEPKTFEAFEPATLIDPLTGEITENGNIQVCVEELMQAVGDDDPVSIIVTSPEGKQIMSTAPNSIIRPAG